jgi:hypothetical protein
MECLAACATDRVNAEGYAMLWDYLKTLITLRLTLQAPCMCAGCERGRRSHGADRDI